MSHENLLIETMQPTKTNPNEHEYKSRRNTSSLAIHASHPNNQSTHTNHSIDINIFDTNHTTNEILYYKIYAIQPLLADKITAMLIDANNKTQIQLLLCSPVILNTNINEAMAVLKDHQRKKYIQSKSIRNSDSNQFRDNQKNTCQNIIIKYAPPANYVCHKCNVVGHWIQDCPLILNTQTQPVQDYTTPPPANYICHRCGISGHWIKNCPTNGNHTFYNKAPSIISSRQSTPAPLCSVSIAETESISNSDINYLSSVNNQSVITNVSPPLQITQIEPETQIINNSCVKPQIKSCVNNKISNIKSAYTEAKMQSFCIIRTVRMIVNAPVSKPILQAVLQQKCILDPIRFQKIFVRCHGSYYHSKSTTVVYIHFVNFNSKEYIECGDKIFNFDYNSTNIIGLMGNKFGVIHRVERKKEYKPIKVPVEYLSKMVNICLRCKWNEAENRKRVCKYCVFEEIEDRNKIAEYYNNPRNQAISKSHIQIEDDLINLLKIEPHLVPLPIYKSKCRALENEGGCTRKNCTYVHNKNQDEFGLKLVKIQKIAFNTRYYRSMNQYELSGYQIVATQFKYRNIISNYYEKQWKYNSKIVNNENNINKIKQYLIKCRIKLHLIPPMYKSVCRDKCRISRGKLCHFIHETNDQTFGDMLFKIKCNAKNNFETQSNASNDEKSELNFENDISEEIKCNSSPLTCAIKPYMEAVNDEKRAEIKELNLWSMNSANISVKIEYNKCNNVRKRTYELYFIYEDDKDAKIQPWRTYINVLFPCEYDVGLRTQIEGHVQKGNKKHLPKSCPACYFNVCNENEHWKLENNTMRLVETYNGYDDMKKRNIKGVVVERLKSINRNKKRYKVKMEKYSLTGFNINWLKFAIVASGTFNKNWSYSKDFDNVYISYEPSPIHEMIKYVLNKLNNGNVDCTAICKMVFGIDNVMPMLINKYNVNAEVIKKLFPRLNDSQIKGICGSLMYNLHMLQGPPATGKTSVCAHISYLWWRLNGSDEKVKIHGMVPTNKGSLVLAQKCMEMNKRMMSIVGENKTKPGKSFKVLYFASDTYLVDLHTNTNNESKVDNQNILMEQICVNVIAENKLRQLKGYKNMNKYQRKEKRKELISIELKSADMIVTTFGNAKNKLLKSIPFTHAICDEANQGSLDTILGIIRSDIKQLTMAGDIQQLAPVIKSNNPLAAKSVYEDIISYLTNKTNKTNTYYTRLLTQYRSHPQIYKITSRLFYHNTVKNPKMSAKREYGNLNYGQLFINNKNHIQWHMYSQTHLECLKRDQQSKCNEYEAHIALKYIKKFIIELGNNERHIAVLSDYRAQIDYMKKLLENVKQINMSEMLLCTTNEIEGSQKPIVIYMCCRSNNTGNIGFLNDNKRVNVALSRAEYGQIIIGDINTLQYNPIYNEIFKYHMKEGAVVTENNAYNRWNKNENWIKTIDVMVPLININKFEYAKLNKRNDYYICSGCGKPELNKLFCGRSCNKIDFCEKCMHKYLWKYCKIADKLPIKSKVIIDKSDFFATDSSGIAMEFDIILGKYLMDYDMCKHMRENELTKKLCDVAMNLCNDIKKKYWKYLPNCFRVLVNKYRNKEVDLIGCNNNCEVNTALGIMRCKRNHLLQQNIMETRFFRIVDKIRYNNYYLKQYYNYNTLNNYNFYLRKEFEEYQPTTVIAAYLQCCGYSTLISNRLKTRIAKALSAINKNNPGRYNKYSVFKLDEIKITKFAEELYSDQHNGIHNILSNDKSNGKINDALQWNYYVIELMQFAIIDDTLGPYYHSLTHEGAMKAEGNFGDKLRAAGFDITTENELKEKGIEPTPDYILNKPWIIEYNGRKIEINWIDFKNQYCSATEWHIEKLNFQAIKYNNKFGVGSFVFSLGFVKPPKGLQLNCYGLLAAVPLSKNYVELFIQKRISDRFKNE